MQDYAVIFDVDGVLTDSYAAHFQSWQRMFGEIGVEFTDEQFRATFGRTNRDIFAELYPGQMDEEQSRRLGDRKEELYREIVRQDFTPLLFGNRDAHWRTEIFGQYDLHNSGLAYMRMLRTDEWKLVRYYRANGLDELYDLKNDPGELTNLYRDTQHRDVRVRLQQRLDERMKAIRDPMVAKSQ